MTDQRTTELFRNVSAAVSETTRNWKKIREGRKLRENGKTRIPQVLRISQYRNFRSELPKYRMKNWSLPQYRKPQCPPPIVPGVVVWFLCAYILMVGWVNARRY